MATILKTYESRNLKANRSLLKPSQTLILPRCWVLNRKISISGVNHTIIALLIDSGSRIDEISSMKLADVDMDQLMITITGKGSKERVVPISIEMRKILYLYMNRQRFKVGSLLFPTKTGTKMNYHNFLRDFKNHCKDLGIENARTSPHGLRHYFAQNYLRMGGDLYRLSRILGHTNIATTQIYM